MANAKGEDKMRKDECGRYTDCHFLQQRRRRMQCLALKDFYNADDLKNLCKDCPFFKTDEEFEKGWNNRRK